MKKMVTIIAIAIVAVGCFLGVLSLKGNHQDSEEIAKRDLANIRAVVMEYEQYKKIEKSPNLIIDYLILQRMDHPLS